MKTAKHPNMASESELSWMKRRTRIAGASGGPRALSSLTDAARQSRSAPAAPVGPPPGVGVGADRRGLRGCGSRASRSGPLASPPRRACVRRDADEPRSALGQCGQRRARCAPDAPARARPLARSEDAACAGGAWPITIGRSTCAPFPCIAHTGSPMPKALAREGSRYPSSLRHAIVVGVPGASAALAVRRALLRDGRKPWRVVVAEHRVRLGREGRWTICVTCGARVVGVQLARLRRRRTAGQARPLRKGMTTPR